LSFYNERSYKLLDIINRLQLQTEASGEWTFSKDRIMKKIIFVMVFLSFSCSNRIREYYESGNLRYEYAVKDRLKHGIALKYYETGELMQKSHWINGEKSGESTVYYKNGKIKLKANFINGKQEGWSYFYDSLENLRGKQQYKMSHLDGDFEGYYSDGSIEVIGENNFMDHTETLYVYYQDSTRKRYEYRKNDSLYYSKDYDRSGKIIGAKFPIKVEEKNGMVCFELLKSIIPNNKLSIEVSFADVVIDGEKKYLRSDSNTLCIDSVKFKNVRSIDGVLCEIYKEDETYQGCNKFSYIRNSN
jgi:antitoxin component YwqK of YwqJK toxin-antitoxin module